MRRARAHSHFDALTREQREQARERAMVIAQQQAMRSRGVVRMQGNKDAHTEADRQKAENQRLHAGDGVVRDGGRPKAPNTPDSRLRQELTRRLASSRAGGGSMTEQPGTRVNTTGNARAGQAFSTITRRGGGRNGSYHVYANGERIFVPSKGPDRSIFRPVAGRQGAVKDSGGLSNPPEVANAGRRQEAIQRILKRRTGQRRPLAHRQQAV